MKTLKVALLQLLPEGSIKKNQEKGMIACRKAKELGADIILFPEMWSTGYVIPENSQELNQLAISSTSEFVHSFGLLASELNVAIGITFLEQYSPSPRNTLCLFDRFGQKILTYAKVHTCDFANERVLTAGESFSVVELNTESGTIKIGAMICYDREFPESARILMLKGAELILVPNACTMELNRLAQLRTRAFENMLGIATANYPLGRKYCNGHSSAFDGIANEDTNRDMLVMEAGEQEGIYIASFPIDQLRTYRKQGIQGNAYRHPQKYPLILSEQIHEPFLRPDHRK